MDRKKFQAAGKIRGEDAEDAELLEKMALKARDYLETFSWCPGIRQLSFAEGVGGICAIFFVELAEKINGEDDQVLWVVVGDLPSAYLDVVDGDSSRSALSRYCDLMEDWAHAVLEHRLSGEQYPVDASPTAVNAQSLLARIAFVRSEIIQPDSDDQDRGQLC